MRHALAGLAVLAASWIVSSPADAHDRGYYSPYYRPYPGGYYVVPGPRHFPPPGHFRPRHIGPRYYAPPTFYVPRRHYYYHGYPPHRGAATFYFRF